MVTEIPRVVYSSLRQPRGSESSAQIARRKIFRVSHHDQEMVLNMQNRSRGTASIGMFGDRYPQFDRGLLKRLLNGSPTLAGDFHDRRMIRLDLNREAVRIEHAIKGQRNGRKGGVPQRLGSAANMNHSNHLHRL